MKKLPLILSLLVAAGFLFFGVQKFGATNPIFSVIAERSGISLFEPGIRMMTGIAEIVAAILLIVPRTKFLGALLGLAILAGAIGFHLSPWLGISVPGMGHSLFIMAIMMLILNSALTVILRKNGHGLDGLLAKSQ